MRLTDKNRQYHADYNYQDSNSISSTPVIDRTSGSLHCEFVCLLFLQAHRETDRFFAASGVHLLQSKQLYHFHHTSFFSQLKSKVGHILVKVASSRINLNTDGSSRISDGVRFRGSSRSHTHPSHSQTSLLLTSYLSPGVPVPHATQCLVCETYRSLSFKAYYQSFFWVLIDLIVELLGLIIKPFDNQTES